MVNGENIPLYIKGKFSELGNSKQCMQSLFEIIHNQEERIFCEYIENFLIVNVTYKDFKVYVKKTAQYLKNNCSIKEHDFVGLLMDNSLNWISMFWAILMLGGKQFQ